MATQANKLGFDVRRITRIASRLETRGLLLRTDRKGGRRFGRRSMDGRIVVAGGFNLRPLIEQAGDLMRLIQHQAQVSERPCNDRERDNDVIRAMRDLGTEHALQAARDVFPRLRPSEVNNTDWLAEIIEALEAVLADFSDVPGRTIEIAWSDTSRRPDTTQVKKPKLVRPRSGAMINHCEQHLACCQFLGRQFKLS